MFICTPSILHKLPEKIIFSHVHSKKLENNDKNGFLEGVYVIIVELCSENFVIVSIAPSETHTLQGILHEIIVNDMNSTYQVQNATRRDTKIRQRLMLGKSVSSGLQSSVWQCGMFQL